MVRSFYPPWTLLLPFNPSAGRRSSVSRFGNQSQLILIARCRLNPFSLNNHFLLKGCRLSFLAAMHGDSFFTRSTFFPIQFNRNLHVGSMIPFLLLLLDAPVYCLYYVARIGFEWCAHVCRCMCGTHAAKKEPDQFERKERETLSLYSDFLRLCSSTAPPRNSAFLSRLQSVSTGSLQNCPSIPKLENITAIHKRSQKWQTRNPSHPKIKRIASG